MTTVAAAAAAAAAVAAEGDAVIIRSVIFCLYAAVYLRVCSST